MMRQLNRYKFLWFMVLMMGTAILIMLSGATLPIWGSLVILIGAILADSASTYACLKIGGREGNPVVAMLFRKITVPGTFVLMWVLWGIVIYFRVIPSSPNSQLAIALAYWLVPMNNLYVMYRLLRKRATTTS